ncbi:MAG: hypothetical protein ACO1RX_14440 [Candidatus Sericytochromatia bacterium]
MKREKISPETQARILSESRRRCAVCFGLERDLKRKKGQIAHINQNPNDNSMDNLIFLCFDHHDEYDSTTRQSKNITASELKVYRKQLFKELKLLWHSGELDTSPEKVSPSIVINVTNAGGAGGAGVFGGGGGGGGAPHGSGGSGGQGFIGEKFSDENDHSN